MFRSGTPKITFGYIVFVHPVWMLRLVENGMTFFPLCILLRIHPIAVRLWLKALYANNAGHRPYIVTQKGASYNWANTQVRPYTGYNISLFRSAQGLFGEHRVF